MPEGVSKNREALGVRDRAFDARRHQYLDEWLHVPGIECRAGGLGWHGLLYSAVVFPREQERGFDGASTLARLIADLQGAIWAIKACAAALDTHAYAVTHDRALTQFIVRDLTTDGPPTRMDELAYVGGILKAGDLFVARSNRPVTQEPNEATSYSRWHRTALTDSAYLADVDFVEIRRDIITAVVESTQANDDDLVRTAFAFLSRAAMQQALLLSLSESLAIPALLVISDRKMVRIGVVQLDRGTYELSQAMRGERQTLVNRYVREESAPYGVAAGQAVSDLYGRPELRRRFGNVVSVQELDAASLARLLDLRMPRPKGPPAPDDDSVDSTSMGGQ